MRLESLHSLYIERLRDMRDAEDQILKALPKVIDRVHHVELRSALERHLEETREHAERLERIFGELDESPRGTRCKGMAGVLEELEALMKEKGDPGVLDAGIIDGAQHVEHYEIAGYGTLCTFAGLLGYDQHQRLLEYSLSEEKKADDTLTNIAEQSINLDALHSVADEREVRRPVEPADLRSRERQTDERRPFFGEEERRF